MAAQDPGNPFPRTPSTGLMGGGASREREGLDALGREGVCTDSGTTGAEVREWEA